MRLWRKLAVTGLAWSVALATAMPILWMALTAFKTNLDALQLPPTLLFRPTLENVEAVAGSASLLRPLVNSAVESGGATLLALLFAVPSAFALAFHGGRHRTAVLLGMLVTRFLPPIGVMMPMYLIYKATGLIDTQLGLVLLLAVTNLPIAVWMLYSSMREIPGDILEAARMDGATTLQQLRHVLLPLCLPGIGSAALLSAVLCWNESFWSIQMTSSAGAPLSAAVATLSGDLEWGHLSAASLLAVGPILLVGWLAQRTFVRGLTFGAVR